MLKPKSFYGDRFLEVDLQLSSALFKTAENPRS